MAIGVAFCYGVYSLVQLFSGHPRWNSAVRAVVGLGAFGLASGLVTFGLVIVLTILGLR